MAVGSVGVAPVRALDAEALVVGQPAGSADRTILDACGLAAADAAAPVTDSNGSADYKHHLVRVMVGRAIREAAARASDPHLAAA